MVSLDEWVENGNLFGVNRDIDYTALRDIISTESNRNFKLVTKIVRESRKDTSLPVLSVCKSSLSKELQVQVEQVANKLFVLESLQTKFKSERVFNHSICTEKILLSTLPDFVHLKDIIKPVSEDYKLLGVVFKCEVGNIDFLELLNYLCEVIDVSDIVLYHIDRNYFVLKVTNNCDIYELQTLIRLSIVNKRAYKMDYKFIITDNLREIIEEALSNSR